MSEQDQPHEQHENQKALLDAAQKATECLADSGWIDFSKVDPDRVERMESELGKVGSGKEEFQLPFHQLGTREVELQDGSVVLMGPVAQFMMEQDNFYMRFLPNHLLGKRYREMAAVQRFRVLFPELDKALCDATPAFEARSHHVQKEGVYDEDDPYNRALHAAYSLMQELVAKDDIVDAEKGLKVKDLSTEVGERFLIS